KQTLSSSSTRELLKFPLTKDRHGQMVVIGKSEPNIPTTEAKHRELYCGLTLVWVLGCVFFFTVWWYRHRAMSARIREGEPIVSERTLEILGRVKARLDQRRPLTLILSRDFDEPGVYGIQRPKLVLPKGVVDALTDQELEAVFLHEVAHIRRCDNLASLFHS